MPSVNKAIIVGHVGQDAQERFTQTGKKVTSFSVATSNGKDRPPSWHNVEAWGLPDGITINKGDLVFVEGRIAYDTWTGKDGGKRTTTKIVGNVYVLTPRTTKDVPF